MLKRVFGSFFKPRKKGFSHPERLINAARIELARDAAKAIKIIREGAAEKIIPSNVCLSIGQFLLAKNNFDSAQLAFTEPPPEWQCATDEVLRFKGYTALTKAKRLVSQGVKPQRYYLRAGPYPLISIIICSINLKLFQRAHISFSRALTGIPHEILEINDAASLCEGYNRGASKALGDILVFSHDDVEVVDADFAEKLLESMSKFDLLGLAGTTYLSRAGWISSGLKHAHGQHGVSHGEDTLVQIFSAEKTAVNAQAIDGFFMATRRKVWEQLRFDQNIFDDWHMYDLDFSYRAYQAGFSVGIRSDFLVYHHQGPMEPGSLKQTHWRIEAEKFLSKFPDLCNRPLNFEPAQLVAIPVSNELEWTLMLQQLHGHETVDRHISHSIYKF